MKTFKEIRTPTINPNDKEEITASKKVPKGYHRMPDGSIMKDSDHPKESHIDEISIAQQQQRRRNRKNASLQKAMAKYRAAAKAGIHPSKVHQRRTKLTVKKG